MYRHHIEDITHSFRLSLSFFFNFDPTSHSQKVATFTEGEAIANIINF